MIQIQFLVAHISAYSFTCTVFFTCLIIDMCFGLCEIAAARGNLFVLSLVCHIDMVGSIQLNERRQQQLRVPVHVCARTRVCQRPHIKNFWRRIMNEVVRINRRIDISNWPRHHWLICANAEATLVAADSLSHFQKPVPTLKWVIGCSTLSSLNPWCE